MAFIFEYSIVPDREAQGVYEKFDRAHSADNAGVDLHCCEDVVVKPGELVFLKLGIRGRLVDEADGQAQHYYLYPRSSISKKGLIMANSVGIIDRSYRGELMGAVRNVTGQDVLVARGERLFQIVAPNMGHICETVCWDSLDETTRGDGGFGSTGN
jgi:dUTP pyrophosphatase